MIVTRFAPSPTGLLHLGHAFAAITAHDMAFSNLAAPRPGRFLLRIEDIDASRCREEFVTAIYEDLCWLGLEWDEPVVRQTARGDAYRAALAALDRMGLVYPCFCTRREIADEIARAVEAPHGPDGAIYPGTCRGLTRDERARRMAAGVTHTLRLDSAKASAQAGAMTFRDLKAGVVAVEPTLLGDIVLARKDMPAAYHLAVVVDDAHQGVTLLTRGEDLFAATHVQRLLQALLGLPEPEYAHHRLILDASGKKFSKRDHAVTLRSLRESGVTPSEIRARLGL
ncbi:MAG: tRNA glutamyl-Q(34) synthetase GluQRS [Alphaproteobacteria bacterium]|nr:tRNA glutamyl-Q(34) synthetase GluQRS [Alphaproteobacteria bacterium]MBL6938886.1 tRNA glutamyl-Q(34) synthetase GluQRS [Alphaproteobacteria bacterium]MBL7099478.1 tRNA glutamyl-Q(34) synthetase GluQRS [Alphaproteobacteria bacterium]